MKRAHVFVSGRVQGVFFRATCREEAQDAGVNGWVRNLPDGRVEAVFEGEDAAVERMVAWCRKGPAGARVTGVDLRWENPQDEKGFRITG